MYPIDIRSIIISLIMPLISIGLIIFAVKKGLMSGFLLTLFRSILSIGVSIFILYLWGILNGDPHPFDQGALVVLGVIYWPIIIILSIIIYNFLGEINFFNTNGN